LSALAGRHQDARGGLNAARARDLDIERVARTALLARVWDLRDSYTPYEASYIALAERSAKTH